jgi:uncharacterized protein YraI
MPAAANKDSFMTMNTIMLASLATLAFVLPALAEQAGPDGRDRQTGRQNWQPMAQPPPYERPNQAHGATGQARRDTMLRAGPRADFPTVRQVGQGQSLAINGCLPDRSWCDVGLGDDRGWLMAADMDGQADGWHDSIDALARAGRIGNRDFDIGSYWDQNYRQQPFYDQRGRWEQQYRDPGQFGQGRDGNDGFDARRYGIALRRQWLLAGPAWAYPKVGLMAAQGRVLIHGCLPTGLWCDVSYRDMRGWVAGATITTSYQGRRQTLLAAAPRLALNRLDFAGDRYWDAHYGKTDFYADRDRWQRRTDWGGDSRQSRGNDSGQGRVPGPPLQRDPRP